jgi:hypothetical protein
VCMAGSSGPTLPIGDALPMTRPPCHRMPAGRTLELCAYQATPCAVCSALDETYGDAWGWVAFAPVWRLVLAFVIGKRTQKSADLLLERVLHVTAAHIPFFTSDQ